MNQFNRQQPDPEMAKRLLKQYYKENKILVFILLGITVALFALGEGIHSIYLASLLYLGGTLFKRFLGEQKLVNTLIFGALAGVLMYLAMFFREQNIVQMTAAALGSAIFAVLVAVGTYAPNFELPFFGRRMVKFRYFVIGFIALGLVFTNAETAYRLASVGGIIYGFLSILLGQKNPYQQKNSFSGIGKFFKRRKRGPHIKNENRQKQSKTQKETDEEYNKRNKREQEDIDRILEKIKQKGYESLSSAEKQKLFDRSK